MKKVKCEVCKGRGGVTQVDTCYRCRGSGFTYDSRFNSVGENFVVAGILVVLVVIVLSIGLVYGRITYGRWECGLPGVQCRIEVKK